MTISFHKSEEIGKACYGQVMIVLSKNEQVSF